MGRVGKLTQIYTLGDNLGFELNDGSVVSFKYGEHEEGLLELLFGLSEELGRVPTFTEVLEHPKMPHPNTFAFYFGSFDKAIDKVEGRRSFFKWKEERERNGKIETRVNKQEGVEIVAKRRTKEEVLALVIEKEAELGRFPTWREFNAAGSGLPAMPTIRRLFGGLGELKAEVEKRKELAKIDAEAVEEILELLTPAKEEVSEDVVGIEKELEDTLGAEKDEQKEAARPLEETPTVSEKTEAVIGAVDETRESQETSQRNDKNEAAEPLQTTIEIKDENGTKTIKIAFKFEISFSL